MGIILVFDMDGVIGPEKGWEPGSPILLNPVIKNLLEKAHRRRNSGEVDAIFLLTKNPSEEYVKGMDAALSSAIGRAAGPSEYKFFDDGLYDDEIYMTRRGYMMYATTASKNIHDVVHMIQYVNKRGKKIRYEGLDRRVFFFDDHPEYHPAMEEVLGDHFIAIQPPYEPGKQDRTDYSALPAFLRPDELAPTTPGVANFEGLFGGFYRSKTCRRKWLKKRVKKQRKTKKSHKK